MLTEVLSNLGLPPLAYVVLVLAVTLMVKSWMNRPANLPPMPVKPYPILGHLPLMKKEPRKTMMEWKEKAGDIFSIYMGTTLVIVFNSYDVLKETLVKQADIFTHRPVSFFGIATGGGKDKGILTTSGLEWKEQRSVAMAILRNFGMGKNSLVEQIHEEISSYLQELSKLKGKPTDVRTVTNASVANVICAIIVGKRFEFDDPQFLNFLNIFNEQVRLGAGTSLLNWFPWLRFLPGDVFSAKKVIKNTLDVLQFFSDHYIKIATQNYDETNIDNFIVAYLREQKKREANGIDTTMDGMNLRRVVSNLFIAGSETTSTTILWFLLFMIHHPDIQKKVYEELDNVVGTERPPNMHDKPNLNYLNAAIMETQRRASILPFSLVHLCTADVTVRGYHIPKNTRIFPNLDAVLLDKKTWGDPMNFRPERFLDDKGNLIYPEEFIPFSLGRRVCMGESLAKMELFLYISGLVQRFEMLPAKADSLPPVKGQFGVTVAPETYEIRLVERRTS